MQVCDSGIGPWSGREGKDARGGAVDCGCVAGEEDSWGNHGGDGGGYYDADEGWEFESRVENAGCAVDGGVDDVGFWIICL